jgi:hypothetical protein
MKRAIASVPETIDELCLVRFGLVARGWSARWYARRMVREVERASAEAAAAGAGLLHSERFAMGRNHLGVWQYWRSFDELDAWSHRPPHSEWWRDAVARMRRRHDLGVYHEAFLVPRANVESIYLNCPTLGLASFGVPGEPVGPMTTGRHRLGRRA